MDLPNEKDYKIEMDFTKAHVNIPLLENKTINLFSIFTELKNKGIDVRPVPNTNNSQIVFVYDGMSCRLTYKGYLAFFGYVNRKKIKKAIDSDIMKLIYNNLEG